MRQEKVKKEKKKLGAQSGMVMKLKHLVARSEQKLKQNKRPTEKH